MPKLLGDFLQEQQEPFALDVYLLERGCSRARLTNLDLRSVKRRSYPIPNSCSKFVKAVFSRLVLHSQKIKNGGSNEEHADDEDKLSSSTVYNSCAESSEVEDVLVEGDAERKVKWRLVEDNNKQLSPISVLEETESDEEEGSPLHHHNEDKMKSRQGECSTYNKVEELQELVDSKMYGQYMINKRALQETKQLLIDCVREVIESHRRKDNKNGEQLKKILGADELWKLVCENVWLWSQDSVDESNVLHLLHYHLMASQQDWNSAFDQQKEEVSMEIGDSILEGIINEILTNFMS